MRRKVVCLLLMLVLGCSMLTAASPGGWVTASVELEMSSSSVADTSGGGVGLGFSWIGFPGRFWLGVETRGGFALSTVPGKDYASGYLFAGPVVSIDITKGILAYLSVGGAWSFAAYSNPSMATGALGVGADLGMRFRVMGSEKSDLALVVGAYGDMGLSLSLTSSNGGGDLTRIIPYVGLALGSANTMPPSNTPLLFSLF